MLQNIGEMSTEVTSVSSDPKVSSGPSVFALPELTLATQLTQDNQSSQVSNDSKVLPEIPVFAPPDLKRTHRHLSRNGNIDDDTIPDRVENEDFDDARISEPDDPPGCVDFSSEEELEKLGNESGDDIVYLIDFIGWRNGGWASQERSSHLQKED